MSMRPVTGLVLTGGGARAAYQIGVLKAVMQIRRDCQAPAGNPFDVITGTSAGALNAAALACRADDFDAALQTLVDTWSHFHAEQVYRADSLGVMRTGARWLTMLSIGWVLAKWRRARPRSLLDNSPLRELLTQLVPLHRLRQVMDGGHLQALAVSASGYGSGLHVTFYDALANIAPWNRSQRVSVAESITIDHLLASSAIPFVFPAVSLGPKGGREYFGDGSMRQAAPISPAVAAWSMQPVSSAASGMSGAWASNGDCARQTPPERCKARIPAAPSLPRPDRITPIFRSNRQSLASDCSRRSIEGCGLIRWGAGTSQSRPSSMSTSVPAGVTWIVPRSGN